MTSLSGWFRLFLCITMWLMLLSRANAQQDTLHVSLDMREPINAGWIDQLTEKVGIRGDVNPLSWGATFLASDPDGDSIYTAIVPFTVPEDSLVVSVKIKVDGSNNPNDGWQKGRNHLVKIYAGVRNELNLAWDDKALAPTSKLTGHIELIEDFHCEELASREIYVYLPPLYNKSSSRYPVLYMHDGQNIFDAAATGQEWRMDEIAENLIRSHEIEPMIIVGIGNTTDRISEYTPTRQLWHHEFTRVTPQLSSGKLSPFTGGFATEQGDSVFFKDQNDSLMVMVPGSDIYQPLTSSNDSVYFLARAGIEFQFQNVTDSAGTDKLMADKEPMGGRGDLYGEFIVQKLKPFIDNKFRTKSDRVNTALGGSSLGGLATLHMGFTYPQIFGALVVLSPSVWWNKRDILKTIEQLPAFERQPVFLYVGTGEGETTVKNVRELRNLLLKKGWSTEKINYVEADDAGHNERAWAAQVKYFLQFLSKKKGM
ncbi:Ferri-bacillibactin esterase BesA [Salinivirga cyanobacteriivorans]|uniref:Ferri-bacillibactin esterase BesA n=1 Tax=Salinivirga cyanobacteriivorans TaxID=1307839 RepID=A0A0S2HWU1_9BACT|nr:alpha/beta hydrolase-fold protein [Salinivirga cyanobacteriivorans]ALO14507.1 Ferri-bacillibactin esterase BesA [Salinivirga cyanobacteriivorans]